MANERSASADYVAAGLIASPGFGELASAPRAFFEVECLDANGDVKWTESVHNVVMAGGKKNILDVYFGATAKPSWYLVLKGAGSATSLDTLDPASPARAWSEVTGVYSSTNRPSVTFGTASIAAVSDATVDDGQIVGTAASISITGSGTVAGCGLTQTALKATVTGSILYNAGDFAASRTVASGDTLNVSLTLTIT